MTPRTLISSLITLCALVFFVPLQALSQQFYVCTSNYDLHRVTLRGGGVTDELVSTCGTGQFFSIAVSGNKLYYNTSYGTIYQADLLNNKPPQAINCTPLSGYSAPGNALTVDKNGAIYYANFMQLNVIEPGTGIVKTLDNMPYESGGDLLFYKDELYMASRFDGIVKIPLDNPSAATVVIPMSVYTMGICVASQAGQLKVFALGEGINGGTDLIELDMDNYTVKGIIGTLPYVVYDAASGSENGELPVINIENVAVTQDCDVINKGLATVTCKAHTSEYTYTLQNGQSNTTGVFGGLAAGDYHVTVTGSEGEQPKLANFTVSDYFLTMPVITVVKRNPVCNLKGDIQLDAGNRNPELNVRFEGNVFDINHKFTGLNVGTHHFTILNKNGCLIDEKDYTLEQDECPPIDITSVQYKAECDLYGKAVVTVVTKEHPDVYTYSLDGVTNETGIFNAVLPGAHRLLVTSFADRKEQEVNVPDFRVINKPALGYNAKPAVCTALGQISFFASGDVKGAEKVLHDGSSYNVGQVIRDLVPGINHFTITDKNGCILDELDIEILQDRCDPVVFPNTFTPNGDGVNDVFRPNQDSNPVAYELFIYTRGGQEVFHSRNVFDGWDGNLKGRAMPAGVYFLAAKYMMGDGKSYLLKSSVTLIK